MKKTSTEQTREEGRTHGVREQSAAEGARAITCTGQNLKAKRGRSVMGAAQKFLKHGRKTETPQRKKERAGVMVMRRKRKKQMTSRAI